jgi:tRNA 2-selenouridine synthase
VEAESRKIGRLQVPESLLQAIRRGSCVCIEATPAARVDFLLRDYDYFTLDPAWLKSRLAALQGVQSNETLARWAGLAEGGHWPALVAALLDEHYDPLYHRSQGVNFAGFTDPQRFPSDDLSDAGIARLAAQIARSAATQEVPSAA